MNDSSLVKKCIEGDQRAQRMLFEKFAPKMLGVCMRYAKNTEQAEDVLQDGFVKVFTNSFRVFETILQNIINLLTFEKKCTQNGNFCDNYLGKSFPFFEARA